MADNELPPRSPATPEPASDAKKHASKLVVLSSVAKAPMSDEDSLLGEPDPSNSPKAQDPKTPPALPRKASEEGLIRPVGWTIRPGGATTIIKLPPKTGVLPRLTSLSTVGKQPEIMPGHPHGTPIHTAPPPLPIKVNEPADGEEETKRLPPVKLHAPTASPEESLFPLFEEKPAASIPEKVVEEAPAKIPPKALEKPAATTPPPLNVTRPGGAMPPPLPTKTAGRISVPSPGKKTTVLLSKSSALPVVTPPAAAALQATTKLAPAPVIPPPAVSVPAATPPITDGKLSETSKPVAPSSETPVPPPEKSRKPFFLFPPAKKKTIEAKTGDAPPLNSAAKLTPAPSASPAPTPIDPTLASAAAAAALLSARAPMTTEPASGAPPKDTTTRNIRPPKPASVTPPKIFPATAPTLPITPASRVRTTLPSRRGPEPVIAPETLAPEVVGAEAVASSTPTAPEKSASQVNRAARVRKRRIIGIIAFYILLVALLPALYYLSLYFSKETRVEGQVIPPEGMVLGNEAWIVNDFRDLASGVASDLSGDRSMVMQEMQEKIDHVQRAQADVAVREGRIRLLKGQIQATNDEQVSLVKQARDASQQIWDGPGAQMEQDYQSRLTALDQSIRNRAKSINITYQPDPAYYSPEVWANSFRLGLYQAPKGVDSVKELQWLDQQMKDWRSFTKAMDAKQNDLRQQAAQLKMAPATKVADLKTQADDLQQRIDGTIAEEEPLKAELEQAQTDLALVRVKEASLDAKPQDKLDSLPETNITQRLPLRSNGRFSWRQLEKDSTYAAGEKSHAYWIFARAFRPDGRQFWALHRFTVDKDTTVILMIEPESFISTKAILRPDLSPDEQAQ